MVDDDLSSATAAAAQLEMSGGYEVSIENDPRQALEHAAGFRPDIIMLDVDMPGRDGGDVAARLRATAEFHSTPIIFRSSLVTATEQGARDGFYYLPKLCRPETLLACVANALAERVVATAEMPS